MPAFSGAPPRSPTGQLLVGLAFGCAWASALAQPDAQSAAPIARASVEQLVELLDTPLTSSRGSFSRAHVPDESTRRCESAADVRRRSGTGEGRIKARNLVVVPYAGDAAPGVHLDVGFAGASAALTPNDRRLLETLARALTDPRLATVRFSVAGHTDTSGGDSVNKPLSCARAVAVARFLADAGVAASRLTAYGFGSQRPLTGFDAAAPQHRRVEIRREP